MIQQFYFLNIYPKKLNQYFEKIFGTPCSCGIFHNRQNMEPAESIDKQGKCYIYKFSHKKRKKILLFATSWMNLEDVMLSEISQTENQTLYDLTHTQN